MAGLLLTAAAPVRSQDGGHLVAGPLLTPALPAAGWLSDHLASWVNEHPDSYAASCRSDSVENELRFLQKIADRDQDLHDTARAQLLHGVVDGDTTAKRHTDIAVDALMPLDNEITEIDRLIIRLTGLPGCKPGAVASVAPTPKPPAKPASVHVPELPPEKEAAAAPSAVPVAPSAAPAPPAAAVPPAKPQKPAAASAPQQAAVAPAAPAGETPGPDRSAAPDTKSFVVRFDNKAVGLTPKSIRVLDTAIDALNARRPVRIAIEGCENRDSPAEGVDCTALTRRLKRILAERGVDKPDALIADPR